MRGFVSLAMLLAAAAWGQGPGQRWNVYGFGAAGSSMGENNAGFSGGGGGAEAFVWKGLAFGADVAAYRDQYYGNRNFGYFGAQAVWHFADREKPKGADPYVLIGAGAYFPGRYEGGGVHGGVGLNYWFVRHVGARLEFRAGSRSYGDNIDGQVRFGVVLR